MVSAGLNSKLRTSSQTSTQVLVEMSVGCGGWLPAIDNPHVGCESILIRPLVAAFDNLATLEVRIARRSVCNNSPMISFLDPGAAKRSHMLNSARRRGMRVWRNEDSYKDQSRDASTWQTMTSPADPS